MNSGATSERVYEALKWRILEGELRPGARLDPTQLASELSASTTPLREALQQLVGEQIVETATSEGFRVPMVGEAALRDLYAWNNEILALALRSRAGYSHGQARDAAAGELRASLPYPMRAATLFEVIARRSANAEHVRAIRGINDRLHAARRAEAEADPRAITDLSDIGDALTQAASRDLASLVRSYHRRRQARATATVRVLLR